MDKNPIKALIEFFEGVGKAVAAANTVAETAGAVADKVRGVQREGASKSVELEVAVKPNGSVTLTCSRFRLSLSPDRARSLGRKLITTADAAETHTEGSE
jgi:hypothetical protein